jgi:hypothetical protein
VDSVGKGINGISVVEGLGTKGLEKNLGVVEGSAVVDVGIGLHNPDKFLAGMVEVELNLVGGRADGFIAGKLHLLDEVLVGVLSHFAPLISVEEDIVDVEGSSNQGLLVRDGSRNSSGGGGGGGEGLDGPETLADGADIEIDLYLVILYESRYPHFRGIYRMDGI